MAAQFAHRNLPRLLLQARESVLAYARPSLRRNGLSDQQWRVLRVLGEQGATDTGSLAREAYLLGPSLSGMLARMERDGLVQRERDPADQRRTLVRATARGQQMVDAISVEIEDHYAWMEKSLGRQRLHALYELLDQVIALERR